MKRLTLKLVCMLLLCTGFIACEENVKEVAADQILLSQDWQVQSSAVVGQTGDQLSSTATPAGDWYPATVPSTVMGTLTANGLYKDLFFGMNFKEADRTPFDVSWWYRTTFKSPVNGEGKHVQLHFDGLTYRANIWLNGKQIGSKEEVYGVFNHFTFDITDLLQEENILAVELFRAQKGEPNMGFVDWNPRPLDENMGIFREVKLLVTGSVGVKDTWVKSDVNTETLAEAWLTVETNVENFTDQPVKGSLKGQIENIRFSIPVTLEPKEVKTIRITPDDVQGLHINNPRLWWSRGLGSPELYDLELTFVSNGVATDVEKTTFGIRTIETFMTEQGFKGFKLNGKRVLIKSAGWTDDVFLRDTPESNEIQVQYVADMNMNSIRFENIWGNSQNIYELCDRYGLMALVGWSCQWEWENYFGGPADEKFGCIQSAHDMDLLVRYFDTQVRWLRNHPAIIAWLGGSDMLLNPTLEQRYMEILPTLDNRPYIGSAATATSAVTGPTGMKMRGPYDYVGPNYWFIDTQNGGNFGFNTETGTGAMLPAIESIAKMIPADKLWPLNAYWDYHCTTAPDMNKLKPMIDVTEGMYGKAADLHSFLNHAYLTGSQATQSMFEAFRVNPEQATGIVQWMLNSAWPKVYWQLYDYYNVPTSGYYGVKRGNLPLQLIYNYKDNGIYAVNETLEAATELTAVIRGNAIDGSVLFEEKKPFSIDGESVANLFTIDNSAKNTFLTIAIIDAAGNQLAENFYVLSSQPDVYGKGNWYMTYIDTYGDFKDLAKLPETEVKVNIAPLAGQEGIAVTLENTSSTVAFLVQLALTDGDKDIVRPVFWSDNYVTLFPGEKKTLDCAFQGGRLSGKPVALKVGGWNIQDQYVDLK